jgi:hypothetical protein
MTKPARDAPKRPVTRRHAAAAFSLLLALSALAIVPSSRSATAVDAKADKLSPRLATLAAGATFASPRAEAKALSVPSSGFGSLVTQPDGRVLVYIRTGDTSSAGVAGLRARGAQIVDVSPEYSTVTAAIAPGALSNVAADPAVVYVMEVLAPQVGALSAGQTRAVAAVASPNVCAPIISEGDTLMNVATARSANHVNGTGEKVGILSDSFNRGSGVATHESDDVAHGELPGPGNPCGFPTPVDVTKDGGGFGLTDEGRAMAQIVHGLAPGAGLVFRSVVDGELDFADQIDNIRADGADVIVDDVFYPNEPFFQDGPIANAARAATAAGVPYFTAAGNSNVFAGGNNVSSYEAPAYRPALCPVPFNPGEVVLDCHDFDTTGATGTSDAITVKPNGGFALDLQWAEPRGAVATDLDVFVINASGTVLAKSISKSTAAGQPVEVLGWGNASASPQTVRIVVARYSGSATPRLKFVFIGSGGIDSVQYNSSTNGDVVGPSILGHSGTSGIGTTAAIPYDDSTTPEDFSSRGPVTHYFQPTPSTATLSGPEVVAKPDFAGTDGVRTSFFAERIGSNWRFYGTSAAAPHAAAIGALLKSKNSRLTPAEVMAAMHDTARSVANNGTADAVGGGYLDANAALTGVPERPGRPRAVAATAGNASAQVTWAAPASDTGVPVTGYAVTPYINGVAQTKQTFNSTATTQVATGLTNGALYAFRVSAIDANGEGGLSDVSERVRVGAPSAPTALTVAGGGSETVKLTWHAPAVSNGATITGYKIVPYLYGSIQPAHNVGTATAASITGLTTGGRYTFIVAARSNRGDSPFSDSSAEIIVGLPGKVTNLAVMPGNGTATLHFTAAPGNGSAIALYTVDVLEGSVVYEEYNYPNDTTLKIYSLVNGHTYRMRVYATNGAGTGPPSAPSPPVTAGTPTAPGAPGVVPGNASAVVHWSASAANGSAVSKYLVTPIVGGVAQPVKTYAGSATGATISGLPNGKKFSFAVKAVNATGTGPPSTSKAVVIGAPTAPTAVVAKTGHAQATLSWTAPAANGSPITGYTVTPYRGGTALKPRVFHSTATKETVTGLGSGDSLTFTVAAINARGTGAASAKTKAILIN